MPSPFPVMDPYLEQTDWTSVHVHLAMEIARVLAPLLRPKYFVRAEKIYILSAPEPSEDRVGWRKPAINVIKSSRTSAASTAGAALLEPPLRLSIPIPQRLAQMSLKIRDAADRSLVTAIEILSMSNKTGTGRKKYLVKRNRFLASQTHLMEIDLLRDGRRMPMSNPLPEALYFVVLSRADRRPIADVWPIALRSPLPTIPVPLLDGDPDVYVDLQAVMNTMFDVFSYDQEIDYNAPLQSPLPDEDAGWARQQIAHWRLA